MANGYCVKHFQVALGRPFCWLWDTWYRVTLGGLQLCASLPWELDRLLPSYSPSHQQLDGLMADDDAVAEGQLGVDAADAVGAARRGVRLTDHLGEPGVPDAAG
jgi:hypothetical protein